MRLVYMGTPEAAVAPLKALVNAGHDVALVVSQPDRKRGRGGALLPSPVKAAAIELGIAVSDDPNHAATADAELGVVVAYGRLIKPHLLALLPFVNIHFSLLPRWRGAAPVERAILAGDKVTGCCLMALEEGLDTGPVYRRVETPIHTEETAAQLRGRLVEIGSAMLVDALSEGFASLGSPQVQTGEPTHAAKLQPSEFEIDWSQPCEAVLATVRLGGAWTTFRGKRIKVLSATLAPEGVSHAAQPGSLDGGVVCCGTGALRLVTVQPEGRSALAASDWRNGAQPKLGDRMGTYEPETID